MSLRVLSLFAGIGGIDLGLEAHGCTTVAYSEVEPYASAVMAQHFPDAVNLGDVTTIDWSAAHDELGPFDIICGGFPCQDISTAGRGAGIDGERSGLWRCYADAVRILRPRGVLVENVAALLARGADRVLGDLAACGYDAEWDCIPAAAVGAPHLRDRLFIVAYGSDLARAAGADLDVAADGECEQLREQPVAVTGSGGAPEPRRLAPWPAPDAASVRRPRPWQPHEPVDPAPCAAGEADQPLDAGWWSDEPDVARVVHGIPNGVERRRALGNAVVPQVAEHVAGILIDRMEAA